MAHADFVHLRVHTGYSLLEGAIRLPELAGLCDRYAMPAVAITDTGNMFGALEFSELMLESGVQPIVGTAIAISREAELSASGRKPDPDTLVLLAQDEIGYGNLMKLSSAAFLKTDAGEIPQISMADVTEHAAGVICLTVGVSGRLGRLLLQGQEAKAEEALLELKAAFGDRLYMEIQRHGLDTERATEAGFVELAFRHDVPLVATNEAYFADPSMYEAHDALICISEGTHVSDRERRRETTEHWFKGADEMRLLFADLPEAISNTVVVAQRCAWAVRRREPLLPAFDAEGGTSESDELRRMAHEGLDRRLREFILPEDASDTEREETERRYRDRLDYELGVIIEMGYQGYFLIVADFIQWARANDVPVGPGRGSGAASLVAYSLTITGLDPIFFALTFERFLNTDRISMPDFDIDFCQDKRGKVIRYVQQKYGYDRVAHIITFGTLQARAALRDVGRVLELPYGQVDRLCKMVPNNPANPVSLERAILEEPRLQHERDTDETVARLLDISQKLEGLYRHASTHAAGIVISDRPLDELVPLYRDPRSDIPVTQFSMKWAEAAGLVKHDFLGLKTLTVIDRAEGLIRERGMEIDTEHLPLDDKPTLDLMAAAETVGIFQFESPGMRNYLRQLKPDHFDELMALNALFRPGPMDSIPSYIARMVGKEKTDYLHDSLKEVLEETRGVMTYQEQVMQVAQKLAGYTLGDADVLRYAMAKKVKSEMDVQREKFIAGALNNNVPVGQANHIFDLVAKFAGYGFPKAHAAAYALVAYQTAYLKANFPLEFLAASMTLDLGNTDKLNVFRQESVRMDVKLLAPDINRSGVVFTVERGSDWRGIDPVRDRADGAVRYALAAIRNVGKAAMQQIVDEREANGDFTSLFDFAHRIDTQAINKRQMENLVKAGTLDSLEPNRAKILESLDLIMAHAQAADQDRRSDQTNLFGDDEVGADSPPLPEVEDFAPLERLTREYEAIGFYLTGHPIEAYGNLGERLGTSTWREIQERLVEGYERSRIACIVLAKRERKSARGNRYADLQLSDPTGVFEVRLFADVLSMSRELLESGQPIIVTVDVERQNDELEFMARKIEGLDEKSMSRAAGLTVILKSVEPVEHVRSVLAREEAGEGAVHVVIPVGDGAREADILLAEKYNITPTVRAALKALPGVAAVNDI